MVRERKADLNGVAQLYQLRQHAENNSPPCDTDFEGRYPRLFSLLSNNRISETAVTDPCSLAIRNAGGDWRFSLSVPGLAMYGDVLAKTVADGFQKIEEQLAGGTFQWKVDTRKGVKIRELKKLKKPIDSP